MSDTIMQSVKLALRDLEELDDLVGRIPLANRHVIHLACVRAGLEVFKGDPERIHRYLGDYRPRVRRQQAR